MNYVVRITGPGVDHQVMVNSAEDFETLELIVAKMRRHFECPICHAAAGSHFITCERWELLGTAAERNSR